MRLFVWAVCAEATEQPSYVITELLYRALRLHRPVIIPRDDNCEL